MASRRVTTSRPGPGYGSGGYPGGDGDPYGAPGGGYQEQGSYQGPAGGGYPGPSDGYPDRGDGYARPGGYPGPRGGSGAYPALPAGGQEEHPAEDAGNDWYSGQPAAANGASFADTGAYRLNGRVIDEYGTGPRSALRDPVRGFPPGPGDAGPTAVIPAISGPQPAQRGGQQERYDDNLQYPPYGQDDFPATRTGLGAPGSFAAPGYDDDFDRAPAPRVGYDDYAVGGDPYTDRLGNGDGNGTPGAAGRGPGKSGRGGPAAGGPLRGKRLLLAALAVVAVGIIGVALYVFVFKSKSPAANPNASGPLPTGSAAPSQQACPKNLGTYCHIESRSDDPTPLTTTEVFPPAFTNETDNLSYQLASTKLDGTCSKAVIGPDLVSALKTYQCTQVLRGSYVSGNGKIMGTIGVVNLATTNGAHYAGKVVGKADFIAPLTSAKGVASKLGNGTGVVEAEFKGHYLILSWSQFVDGTKPTTTAQNNQLKQFSDDLVKGTVNISLSQRMVTGEPAKPGQQ